MRLILAEKEEAARAIGMILSGGALEQRELDGMTYFEFGDTQVAAARGHLIEPAVKGIITTKSIEELPKTEVGWRVRKRNKERLKTIGVLCRDAKEIIIATDWDREGEVIGWNILRHLRIEEDPGKIKRAYFSALTEREVTHAFKDLGLMDEALLTQGLARNYADVVVGLNLTKALTLEFKSKYTRMSQAMSLGRVQSPLLSKVNKETQVNVNEEGMLREVDDITWNHYLVLDGIHYQLDLGDVKQPIGELEVVGVEDETEDVDQAEPLFNTNDILAAIEIDPRAIMNTLESLYLKGYSTYPRTKSRYIDPEILKALEATIREHKNLPEEFSHEYAPVGEREKKQAIALTEEGIRALFVEKLRGHERIIAKVILNQMMRSFACPLEQTQTHVVVRLPWGEEKTFVWSKEISNLELAISYTTDQARPDLKPGTYEATSVQEKVAKRSSLYPIYAREVKVFTDTDLVGWMADEEIGTEATRANFPGLLRTRHYTAESNLPTALGEEVAGIIEALGIDTELTREMEQRIEGIKRLSELPEFRRWVMDATRGFLVKFADAPMINLSCPRGHEVELINTTHGLLMLCRECSPKGKFYRI